MELDHKPSNAGRVALDVANSAAMEERILAALDQLSVRGTWQAVIVAAVIVLGWIGFALLWTRLRSYQDEKGKNLATKEDVATLTRLAEEVRHEFDSLREASSQQNRLQLAALDKRLEAHQAAFRVWHLLAKAYRFGDRVTGEEADEEGQDVKSALAAWGNLWETQSLYLDGETRAAVHRLASLHGDRMSKVKQHKRDQSRHGLHSSLPPPDARMENAVQTSMLQSKLEFVDRDIRSVRDLIEQGVHLPPLRHQDGART